MLNVTQDNYDTSLQDVRNLYIKVYLLNYQMQIVDELSGSIISGTVTIDANSDIRRTCNIEMVMEDNQFDIEQGKIWLDKYIKIYTGVEKFTDGEIDWINQGVYLINDPTISYTATEAKLTFQGIDLMSKLTGLRNGYLPNIITQIPQGSSIRNSMISVLTQYGGFTKYVIAENPIATPYDINVNLGGTVFDILKELRDISANYEIFFDVDGTFIYQKIPTGKDDQVIVTQETWNTNSLSTEKAKNFSDIKNVIQVYGKSLEPNVFQSNYTYVESGAYVIPVNTSVSNGDIIGFIAPSILVNPKIKINSVVGNLVNEDGTFAVIPEANEYYCIRKQSNGTYLYMGRQQIYAIAKDENPNSPYYIGGTIGEIMVPLRGGDYDNIWSDDLALQRAKYELYLRARMNDSITITCVPIYYMDVNIKIEHQIDETYDLNQYLVKSITTDLSPSGTQSIKAIRFYPEYPEW